MLFSFIEQITRAVSRRIFWNCALWSRHSFFGVSDTDTRKHTVVNLLNCLIFV